MMQTALFLASTLFTLLIQSIARLVLFIARLGECLKTWTFGDIRQSLRDLRGSAPTWKELIDVLGTSGVGLQTLESRWHRLQGTGDDININRGCLLLLQTHLADHPMIDSRALHFSSCGSNVPCGGFDPCRLDKMTLDSWKSDFQHTEAVFAKLHRHPHDLPPRKWCPESERAWAGFFWNCQAKWIEHCFFVFLMVFWWMGI